MNCVNGELVEYPLPGYRKTAKYPFITGRIFIEEKEYGIVRFLIDTGAGFTLIGSRDAIRLRLTELRGRGIKVIGVSASEKDIYVKSPVTIEFIDSQESDNVLSVETDGITYRGLPKRRGKEFQEQLYIPSLLGWDVLGQLILIIDYKNNVVKLCKNNHVTL